MRPTIKDIFFSWKRSILMIALFMLLIVFTAIEENVSFKKVENLNKQRALIALITENGRKDLEFANIQYRGKSVMLDLLFEQLQTLDSFDLMNKLFTTYDEEYRHDLKSLKEMIGHFTHRAGLWYAPDETGLKLKESEMLDSKTSILKHIDHMLTRNSSYDKASSMIQQTLIYLALLFILIHAIVHTRRFTLILKDIDSLHMVNAQGDPYIPVTDEITIISKRMNRKATASKDPALMDSVTEISNLKGLLYTYANKKSVRDGAYVAVAIFEVDGIEILDEKYSVEFTRSLLKKIAFIMSLHQQPADIFGRTDNSQFTVIFTRNNRDQTLKDCQLIMNSVKETVFKTPEGDDLALTLSTGFAPKHSNISIDESMGHAKKALEKAKAEGPNRLIQT